MSMTFLPKLPNIFSSGGSNHSADDAIDSDLIRYEAEIGGSLFGPVPKGHSRQFFCLDIHTWVWHEEWSENGRQKAVTTRYEVRPNGVLKAQDGSSYQIVSRDEARNLYRATELYRQQIGVEYQRMLQTA